MTTRRTDYDTVAPHYDERYQGKTRYALEGLASIIDAFVGVDTDVRMLEVGCGTGHWLSLLSARGVSVAGIDASAEMLARAKDKLPGVELVVGRAETLPWQDATFDRVMAVNALHHFVDGQGFVREARRVLRTGGRVLTIGLDPSTRLDRWFVYDWFEPTFDLDLKRYPPAGRIRDWLAAAGFVDIDTRVATHIVAAMDAELALSQGRLDATTTSQLAILTTEEYERGISRIRERIAAEKAAGSSLELRADLRLYASYGRVPGTEERT
jgi:ubiquinone/menaquinone biosynthesis C-methylase UbiE